MRGLGNAIRMGDRVAAEVAVTEASRHEAFRTRHEYGRDMIPARITAFTSVVTDLKWSYDWEEVRFTASTASVADKLNGFTSAFERKAYNWNELANAAGPPEFWAPLGGTGNIPVGWTVKPIAIGTPVLLFPVRDTTGALYWVFDKVNAIDGACPEGVTDEEEEPPEEPE